MPRPPSTGSTAPEMYAAPSEARKTTAAAISSGAAYRRSGTWSMISVRRASGQRPGHVGVDEARRDDIGGDVPGAQLPGDRPGQSDQAGLGGRVVGLAGAAGEPDHRRDEDHPAPALAQHAGGGPLGHPVGPGQVRVDHRAERVLAHPQQQRVVGDPGVGHQHLDRALVLLHLGERGVDAGRVGDVTDHPGQPGRRLAGAVGDGHPVPGLGQWPWRWPGRSLGFHR